MRILFTLVLRNASMPGGLAVLVVSLWLAFSARLPGLNLWADLVTGLSSASIFTGALGAGFAAFEANRWTNANVYRARYGYRSPAHIRLWHWGATIAPLLAGYCLSVLALYVYAVGSGTYGTPSLAWLVALGSANVAASSFGYALGSFFGRFWLVAPAAAILYYSLFIFFQSAPLPFSVQSLFPAVTNLDSVFVQHIETTMIGQTLLWLAVAVLIAVLVGGGWRRRQSLLLGSVVGVLVVAAVFGGSLVVLTGGQYTTGYNARDFQCKAASATICLNRGYANGLGPLSDQFDRLNSIVEGTPLYATRLEQNVEGVGDAPSPGSRSVYLEKLENDEDIQFSVYRYVNDNGGSAMCALADDNVRIAMLYVESWLSEYFYLLDGLPGAERLEALQSLEGDAAREWFHSVRDLYFTCSLSLNDLP